MFRRVLPEDTALFRVRDREHVEIRRHGAPSGYRLALTSRPPGKGPLWNNKTPDITTLRVGSARTLPK